MFLFDLRLKKFPEIVMFAVKYFDCEIHGLSLLNPFCHKVMVSMQASTLAF